MMINQLSNLVTRDIVVTQDFCNYADQLHNEGGFVNRKHCDYLLLEWWLLYGADKPLVKMPNNYKHDFRILDHFIDAKRLESINYNITRSKSRDGKTAEQKLDMMKSRVSQGELTHFLFYTTIDTKEQFEVGQVVPHAFFAYEEANTVLLKMQKSQYDGYYYRPKKMISY